MDESLIQPEPVVRLCKLRPLPFGESDSNEDVFCQDGRIVLHDPQAKRTDIPKEYPVDFIYGPLTTAADVANRDVPRLVQAVIRGMDAMLICMGGDEAGKSFTLDGRDGICCHSIRQLYSGLVEKKKEQTRDAASSYNFTFKLRYYELYNEHVTDLLAERMGAAIQVEDTIDGVQVVGLMGIICASAQEAINTVEKCQKKRNTAKKKTHTILQLDVTQTDHRRITGSFSKLLIVETASLDCIASDRDVIQLREGFNAFRAIYCFQDLVLTWQGKQVGEVHGSLLTWILHSFFAGGNVVATVLLCLQHMQYQVSFRAMEMMRALSHIRTNPVPLDNRLIGLYRSLKMENMQTKQALATLRQYAQSVEVDAQTKKHIHELEGRVLEEEIGRVKALEQKRFLQGKVEELKEKYRGAVVAQAKIQKDLILSEEERLKVSQALVTMRIRMTNIQNDLSEQQFQDTAKIVTFEHDLVDLTLQTREKADMCEALQKNLTETESVRRSVAMELMSTSKNMANMKEELEHEQVRTEELSVELVQLIHQKAELEKQLDSTRTTLTGIRESEQSARTSNETFEKENVHLQSRVRELEKHMDDETTKRLKKEIEFDQLHLHAENVKMQLEKSYMERSKIQHAEFISFQTQNQTESSKIALQLTEILKDMEESEKEIRSLKGQVMELQQEKIMAKSAEAEVKEINSKIEQESMKMKRGFHKKLSQMVMELHGEGDIPEAFEESTFEDAKNVDDVLAKTVELVNLAGAKEKDFLAQNRRLTAHCRALQDKLVWLRQLSLEWAPGTAGQQKSKVATSLDDAFLEAEKNAGGDADTSMFSDFNKQLRAELEQERARMAQENMDLHEKAKTSMMEVAQAQSELIELRKSKGEAPALESSKTGESRSHQEIVKQNADLQGKVDRLSSQTPAKFKSLQARVDFLQESVRKLESERSQLLVRANVAEEQLTQNETHMKQMIDDYQRQIAQLKSAK